MVEATSEQLVDYQMALIATTILHDAPSQNWTSQKPFYEGIIIEAMFQFFHAQNINRVFLYQEINYQ